MFQALSSAYKLSKYRRTLHHYDKLYRRKATQLNNLAKERIQELLTLLQTALFEKNISTAREMSQLLDTAAREHMPKTSWDRLLDTTRSLLFALVVAIAIRQTWFELYTIPTGSMRPTLKEQDFLVVSKTGFGINKLTPTSHYLFDPSLVQRGSIVIFSGQNMDISDVDTTYFFLIPGKKQYIKRLIGKPGDTLYFYGGQIYGVDAQGNDLRELRELACFQDNEHIPFIRFEGKAHTPTIPLQGVFSPVTFAQMNEPIAKLTAHANGTISGHLMHRGAALDIGDLWGFKHFATARLLTPAVAEQLYPAQMQEKSATHQLILELTHQPSLKGAQLGRDESGRIRPQLSTTISLLPLNRAQLDALMDHMTTCRFIVKDGLVTRYGSSFHQPQFLPRMPQVPDGTYEILDGVAYRIHWGGVTTTLPTTHPLLSHDLQQIYTLYNLGIEMDTHFLPSATAKEPRLLPSRYAYFRNGDLYLLGAPIVSKTEPLLQKIAFQDLGPPMKGDLLDQEFIRSFGVKVPDGQYLVMGDNHAMSADSRHFGFVPQDNLRGTPSFILWPPGPRWGKISQAPTPWFTLPMVIVWGTFLLSGIGYTLYIRRKYSQPLSF